MDGHAQTQIINIPWTENVDSCLRISAGIDLELVKQQVLSGVAQLWRCTQGDQYKCYVVTRIDKLGDGTNELCLVLGEGNGLDIFAPIFINFAKRKKLSFRTHVKRKGLIRMYAKHGLEVDEYVLRIANGL